jgi:hypothetical protein
MKQDGTIGGQAHGFAGEETVQTGLRCFGQQAREDRMGRAGPRRDVPAIWARGLMPRPGKTELVTAVDDA